MDYYDEYDSPVGQLLLCSDGEHLTGLWMNRTPPEGAEQAQLPVFDQVSDWLDGYFRGENPPLENIPMKPDGTAFQQQVWKLMQDIPWGCTRTYGDLAGELTRRMGKDKMSAQAVGQAVGANPIAIIVPCHRVLGAKGKLTGYAYGLDKKIWLLKHERNDCV